MTDIALRPATVDDAVTVARIWWEGWDDGHRGHVPQALVAVRTPQSFTERAVDRVGDTTVAVVDGDVAGFTMVVGEELEQLYVSRSHRGAVASLHRRHDRLTGPDMERPPSRVFLVGQNREARGPGDCGEFAGARR